MDTQSPKFKVRLGIFIAIGLTLFSVGIFFIGKQKHMFNDVFRVSTYFNNVSGLLVGTNVRFAGITVGTVDRIKIINDSTVQVDMIIEKEVQQFIKEDCEVNIGTSGIIGDRILIISQGGVDAPLATDGQLLSSVEPVETDAIMQNLSVTSYHTAIVSEQLAEILIKVNSGNSALGRLIQDSSMANNIDQTFENLKNSSQGLDENMEAAKHNIFLKGYFNKKKRAAAKKAEPAKTK